MKATGLLNLEYFFWVPYVPAFADFWYATIKKYPLKSAWFPTRGLLTRNYFFVISFYHKLQNIRHWRPPGFLRTKNIVRQNENWLLGSIIPWNISHVSIKCNFMNIWNRFVCQGLLFIKLESYKNWRSLIGWFSRAKIKSINVCNSKIFLSVRRPSYETAVLMKEFFNDLKKLGRDLAVVFIYLVTLISWKGKSRTRKKLRS